MQAVDEMVKRARAWWKFRRMEAGRQRKMVDFSRGAQDGPTTNFECCIHRASVQRRKNTERKYQTDACTQGAAENVEDIKSADELQK